MVDGVVMSWLEQGAGSGGEGDPPTTTLGVGKGGGRCSGGASLANHLAEGHFGG